MVKVPNTLCLEFRQRTIPPIRKYIASIVKTVLEVTNEKNHTLMSQIILQMLFWTSAEAVSFGKQESQTVSV